MKLKTFKECCSEVAQKHRLGNNLVTGHRYSYYEEACELFANQAIDYVLEHGRENQQTITDLKKEIFKRLKL